MVKLILVIILVSLTYTQLFESYSVTYRCLWQAKEVITHCGNLWDFGNALWKCVITLLAHHTRPCSIHPNAIHTGVGVWWSCFPLTLGIDTVMFPHFYDTLISYLAHSLITKSSVQKAHDGSCGSSKYRSTTINI